MSRHASRSWERPKGATVTVKLTNPKQRAADPEPMDEPEASAIPPEISEASHSALARHGVRYPPRDPEGIPGDRLRRVAAYAGGARRSAPVAWSPPPRPPRPSQPPPKKESARPAFESWTLQELIEELEAEGT